MNYFDSDPNLSLDPFVLPLQDRPTVGICLDQKFEALITLEQYWVSKSHLDLLDEPQLIFNLRLLETHLDRVHRLHDSLILILNAFCYEQETYELVGALYDITQNFISSVSPPLLMSLHQKVSQL